MLNPKAIDTIKGFCKPAVENGLLPREDLREATKILRDTLKNRDEDKKKTTPPQRMLKTKEVADLLQIHPKTVLRMAQRGDIPKLYLCPGNLKSLRFRYSDILELMDGEVA